MAIDYTQFKSNLAVGMRVRLKEKPSVTGVVTGIVVLLDGDKKFVGHMVASDFDWIAGDDPEGPPLVIREGSSVGWFSEDRLERVDMGFQKFGSGEVIGPDENDKQGISKQATTGQDEWTPQDAEELVQESSQNPNEG